ncbi:MAG: CHAD domain-containing protein [Deltaproteobacteria bacterium]|nr:CHAD domain-containing protein [Deltaproteobacteria bacterium]
MNDTPTDEAGAFLRTVLRALDGDLAARLPRLADPADARAVHDVRVTLRRVRVALRLSRPLFGRFLADEVRAGFAGFQRATGTLRDDEVLLDTVRGLGLPDAALTRWCAQRLRRQRALRRAAVRLSQGPALARARGLLWFLTELPTRPRRAQGLHHFAAAAVKRQARRVRDLGEVALTDPTGLHALRIAYKRLRYALVLLAPGLPEDAHARAREASRHQDALGAAHDLTVALAAVGRARGLPAALRARVRGALAAREAEALGALAALRGGSAGEGTDCAAGQS